MEILVENPPNYKLLKEALPLVKENLFCYGDTIYNPHNNYVDPIVEKHEAVHSRQQGNNPEEWWQRYIVDSAFRFTQEAEAYQDQYKNLRKITKDRNKLFRWLHQLAIDLSSPVYGSVCSYQEAIKVIKGKDKFKV